MAAVPVDATAAQVAAPIPQSDVSDTLTVLAPLQHSDLTTFGFVGWSPSGLFSWVLELINVSPSLPWFHTIIVDMLLSCLLLLSCLVLISHLLLLSHFSFSHVYCFSSSPSSSSTILLPLPYTSHICSNSRKNLTKPLVTLIHLGGYPYPLWQVRVLAGTGMGTEKKHGSYLGHTLAMVL
jgi:hypothetical protein